MELFVILSFVVTFLLMISVVPQSEKMFNIIINLIILSLLLVILISFTI